MKKEKTREELNYIIGSDSKKVIIDVTKWQGEQRVTVTVREVIEYYKTEAINTENEMRTLGDITGHWKAIDNLAEDLLNYFKKNSPKWLESEAIRKGLKLI